jgi:hypothetical protein
MPTSAITFPPDLIAKVYECERLKNEIPRLPEPFYADFEKRMQAYKEAITRYRKKLEEVAEAHAQLTKEQKLEFVKQYASKL